MPIRLFLITLLKTQNLILELFFESEDDLSQQLLLKTILSLYMKYKHNLKYRGSRTFAEASAASERLNI